MRVICLSFITAALALSLPLTWWLIRLGQRLGQVDVPDAPGAGRKDHARPIPNTGGVAIFLAIFLPLAGALAAIWLVPQDAWTGPLAPAAAHIARLRLH